MPGIPSGRAVSEKPVSQDHDSTAAAVLHARGDMTLLGRRPFRPLSSVLPSPPTDSDDESESAYRVRSMDVIMDRYCVHHGIGHGTFGTVVKAEDRITGSVVAIKLLHKSEYLHTDIHHERRVYEKLVGGCDPHIEYFAAVLGRGVHRGFPFTVFELCQSSLYDIMQGFSGLLPLPARHILEIGYQLVKGVEYMHKLGMIHTDLKPDNIALRCDDTTVVRWLDPLTGFHEKSILVKAQICILDLGNVVDAIPTGNQGRIGSRQYRAPEVSLGLPWSFGVDAFAIGGILAELYLGEKLVSADVDTDGEHVAAIDRLVGPFPEAYARFIETRYPGTFNFEDTITVNYPLFNATPTPTDHASAMRRLERMRAVSARVHNVLLCDLIKRLMAPEPISRLTLDGAARHGYFDALRVLQLG